MEDLPAIYQREEEHPDSFLRSLVGVLETTTQDLDARIASLGSHIHPNTASGQWLDFIARWLGVPWDDALSVDQKRAIIRRAADLAKSRGTRAGLETLLECLIPRRPRPFRVTDATADFGFAVLGGKSCRGSSLPAIIGGSTPWHAVLDSNAVLDYVRLPCSEKVDDGTWQFVGKIRVEIAATAAERKACEPWLLSLVTEMIPMTARVEQHWVYADALRIKRLDDTLVLESAPLPHLGTDAVTGLARLPDRETRLSPTGPVIGAPLN
jgi:phage tail-like protein